MLFLLKFNNILIPDFVKVKSVDIQVLPDVSTNTKTTSGGFGCISGKSTFTSKKITATISIVIPEGETLQSCGRVLAKWLRGNNYRESPLVIMDDDTVYYMAKVSNSVALADAIFVGEGTIEFIVPSGLALSSSSKTTTGTNKVTINNEGSHSTLPNIYLTLNTNLNNSTILLTNNSTGDKVILIGSFQSGDKISINCSKHLVKVNDNVSMNIVGYNTKFFEIAEGSHEISASVNSSLKVIFQERWV